MKLENSKKKMDLGWGGVPRQQPSDTALKYLNEFHKVLVCFHVYKEFQTFFDKLFLERERAAKWISPSLYKNHGRGGRSSCT